MTDAGYVIAGYALVFGTIGAYVTRLLLRGRALSKDVPPESRRWM
jgi:hypothetical protein